MMCYDKPYSPPAPPPSEQRQNVCLDVGCSIIKAVKVAPTAGAVYYEDCDGNVVAGEEIACPTDVFVVNPPTDPIVVASSATDCAGVTTPVDTEQYASRVINEPGTVLNVRVCNTVDNELVLRCDPVLNHTISLHYDVTTTPPTLLSAWNLSTNTAFVGDLLTLESCSNAALESDPIEMCDSGVTFLRWVLLQDGTPTGTFLDTDVNLSPYTVVGTPTVGACAVNTATTVYHGGRNIASGTFTASHDPAGNGSSWVLPGAFGKLQSITVTVLRAGNTPASPNTVMVSGDYGKFFLIQGQTQTFSTVQDFGTHRDILSPSFEVVCQGDSAALVTWTEV